MLIQNKRPLKIYVKDSSIQSVMFAVKSMVSNIEDIFVKPIFESNEELADISIKIQPLSHIEEFKYSIKDDKVTILGNDDLGLIYGIYSFLENELNIPPYYLIEGLSLIKRESLLLEDKEVNEYPNTRFRGWFVNDEDLLTGFKHLGKRDIDYVFYINVVHPDLMDMIAETVLRYRMNLVIPASLININNQYEKNLLDCCAKRGLYISQHHIEPLGLSKFGFEKWAKERNLDTAYSYVSNKDNLVSCWKEYIAKWSEYPRVIFQVGLRGGTDLPVWATEKNISSSPKDRGELIGNAIKTQVELIKDIYPYEINITSTLWMEGADLLNQGVLDLPDDVTVVFADIGMSQMFGNDFFEVKRMKVKTYGIYYHCGYWHTGPHLIEGVIPEKMKYCYDLVKEYNTDYYSILNVANIKEHTFGIYLNSKLTWYKIIALEEIYNKYASFYFNNENREKLINTMKSFYLAQGDVGEEQYERFCKKYDFSYRKYENLPFPVVTFNDGMFRSIIYCFYFEQREPVKTARLRDVCSENVDRMMEIHYQFEDIMNQLPFEYKVGFGEHWVYQSLFISRLMQSGIYFYDATIAANNLDFDQAKNLLELSKQECQKVLDDRTKYYVGEYKNWFAFEKKIDLEFLTRRIPEEYDRMIQILKK